MTTTPIIINFDAIIQGLEDISNSKVSSNNYESSDSISSYIEDIRTIGIHAPRQTGKTWYVSGMINNNDDCVAIVPNQSIKSNMTNIHNVSSDKIATSLDLLNMDNKKAKAFFKKKVFVDESGYVFDRIRRNKFYQLVADSVGKDALVILIN